MADPRSGISSKKLQSVLMSFLSVEIEYEVPRTDQRELVDLIPALRAFARSFCKNPNDADDLVQETLMKGIANLDRFQHGTNLKSWLFTIMRNTFYTKAKVARRESPGLADCASSQPVTFANQEWAQRGVELQRAINALPEDQRQVIVLIGMLGTSYEDAADICQCAIGTIKSRLNRARSRLLDLMGEPNTREAVLSVVAKSALPSLSN